MAVGGFGGALLAVEFGCKVEGIVGFVVRFSSPTDLPGREEYSGGFGKLLFTEVIEEAEEEVEDSAGDPDTKRERECD